MAVPYLHFKYITRKPKAEDLPMGRKARRLARGRTRSAKTVVASAAYRSGQALEDEHFERTYDYRRKQNVEYTEIMAPANAPEWVSDRQRLWNAVEESNIRYDARLAREVTVALPRELTPEQNIELTREYVQQAFVDRGMVADVAIHSADKTATHENPHAHIMLTTREIGPEGFGAVNREWNTRELVTGSRKLWEQTANRHLERAGQKQRICMDSLEEQARAARERGDYKKAIQLTRRPQAKKGPAVTHTERKGTADRYKNGPAQRRYRERQKRLPNETYYREKRGELIRERHNLEKQSRPAPTRDKRRARWVDPEAPAETEQERRERAAREKREARRADPPAPAEPQRQEPPAPPEHQPTEQELREMVQEANAQLERRSLEDDGRWKGEEIPGEDRAPTQQEARIEQSRREADAAQKAEAERLARLQQQRPPARREHPPNLRVTATMSERDHQQRIELARTDPKAAAALTKRYDAFLKRKAAELRPEAEEKIAVEGAYLDEQRAQAERWKQAAEEKLAETPKPRPKFDRDKWRESLKEGAAYYAERLTEATDKYVRPQQERAAEEASKTAERRRLDERYRGVSHAETREQLTRFVRQSERSIEQIEERRTEAGLTAEAKATELARERYPRHAQASAAVSEHHDAHEKKRERLEEQQRKQEKARRMQKEAQEEKQRTKGGGRGGRRIDPPGGRGR